MRRYLFCGPTLPDAAELVSGEDFEIRPPVAAGELLRLPLTAGDVVGIVDGYFHQTRAVRHKEILSVLDKGVRILGAASIGALRAAELDRYGMTGIGGIYRDYRDGVLVADDEVALSHGPAESGYRPFSAPLVNLRAAFAWLEGQGLLDADARAALVERLSRMHYPGRTLRKVRELGRTLELPVRTREALDGLEDPVNRKRDDALLLLDVLRSGAPAAPETEPLSHTIFLRSWELKATGQDTGDGAGWLPDLAVLRICQLFAADYPAHHRKRVLDRLGQECTRATGTDPTARAIEHGVHRGWYPPLTEPKAFSFLTMWLTPAERDALSLAEQVVTFLVRGFQLAPGVPDDLGGLSAVRQNEVAVRAARELAAAARVINGTAAAGNSRFDLLSLDGAKISDWFADRWHTTPDELELHALDRGIDSIATLIAAARPYYLAAKHNPELVAAIRLTG